MFKSDYFYWLQHPLCTRQLIDDMCVSLMLAYGVCVCVMGLVLRALAVLAAAAAASAAAGRAEGPWRGDQRGGRHGQSQAQLQGLGRGRPQPRCPGAAAC